MEWLNLRTSVLHSQEYIGSEPRARATWLNVMLWCVQQENGGRINSAEAWKDRQWQQTCGVTAREVAAAAPLLNFEGGALVVWNYPSDKEHAVRENRKRGQNGGRASAQARAQARAQASAQPVAQPNAQAVGATEREGNRNRNRNRKGNGIQSSPQAGEVLVLTDGESAKEPEKSRKSNPLFDALANAEGSTDGITRSAARAIGVALAEIKSASPDVTPEEIARRATNYRGQMPGATLTANALAKHWSRCANGAATTPQPGTNRHQLPASKHHELSWDHGFIMENERRTAAGLAELTPEQYKATA